MTLTNLLGNLKNFFSKQSLTQTKKNSIKKEGLETIKRINRIYSETVDIHSWLAILSGEINGPLFTCSFKKDIKPYILIFYSKFNEYKIQVRRTEKKDTYVFFIKHKKKNLNGSWLKYADETLLLSRKDFTLKIIEIIEMEIYYLCLKEDF